jgi:hypothetical protein
MSRIVVFAGIVAAAIGSAVAADSAAQLLEKGIYTEHTVGDLDKAIAIYQQVLAEAKTARALAAQAQYHIGHCLLKQGKTAEAAAAFEKLISGFPEAKDLVAKAEKLVPAGLPLEAVPWVDGETLQLRMRLAVGLDIGTTIYFAQSAEHDGRKVWRVGQRLLVTLNKMQQASRVDADWNTFRPIDSVFRHSLLGNYCEKWGPGEVAVTSSGPKGESTRKVEVSRVVYDNEQAMHVVRRLPLAVGYKTTLPVFSPLGTQIDLPLEVQAKESVQTPAGRFECFKVHLGLVNQTFWFATDPHRYLVKFSANSVDAELVAIGQSKLGQPTRYEDPKQRFSFSAPADWYFHAMDPARVLLLDPQAVAMTVLRTAKTADLKAEQVESPRAWADAEVASAGKTHQAYKVRPQCRQDRTVAGLPAASFAAEYLDGKRKMVDCRTYVLGKSTGFEFASTLPAEQLESFRKQLDTIIDSFRIKSP